VLGACPGLRARVCGVCLCVCVCVCVCVSVRVALAAAAVGPAAFDSKWVPPVGGAPSRHTSTGGAADGVHAQCLRGSGAGEPGAEWCPEASS
jgi:hypothetical protein